MRIDRLTQLADGIFAIVMTLLVIEMRVPELIDTVTSADIWSALINMAPVFMSYLLSFVLLFTYWRAHHFIVSGYAEDIDSKLININAVFFFFVALIPFSSALLGRYSETQIVVVLFSAHVIVIGLVLYWMRNHILFADTIRNVAVPFHTLLHSNIRIGLPIFFALLAILLSFFGSTLPLALLTLAVFFNLFTRSTQMIDWILHNVFRIHIGE